MGLRYAVTGSRGQLGRWLTRASDETGTGPRLVADFAHAELDICQPAAVEAALAAVPGGPPDLLVNAAAYNQVDACEDAGAREARRVNGEAPGVLARACEAAGARLVHVSTDYVFPGDATKPIAEDALPGPRTAYGRSKLEGEEGVRAVSGRALIVRTSWVFGPGRNFVGAILRQARLRDRGEATGPLRVVDDQRGFPTYAADLAAGILALASALGDGPGGVFHLCNGPVYNGPGEPAEEAITWWDFARTILDRQGHPDLAIERISSEESGARAPRPAYSVLGCEKAAALGVRLRSWREALDAYLASPDLAFTLELQDPHA